MFEEWFPPRYPERRRVVVNTKGRDETYRGILWERTREHLVLKDAELLPKGGGAPIGFGGELLIDRGNVEYIQVLYGVS